MKGLCQLRSNCFHLSIDASCCRGPFFYKTHVTLGCAFFGIRLFEMDRLTGHGSHTSPEVGSTAGLGTMGGICCRLDRRQGVRHYAPQQVRFLRFAQSGRRGSVRELGQACLTKGARLT